MNPARGVPAESVERKQTEFGFPVLSGKEVTAVLEFFSTEAEELNAPLLDTMANIGTLVGRVLERQRALEALKEREERFRSIIQTANDAFIGMDTEGFIFDEVMAQILRLQKMAQTRIST